MASKKDEKPDSSLWFDHVLLVSELIFCVLFNVSDPHWYPTSADPDPAIDLYFDPGSKPPH